jgi:uncharacterized protein (UPF0335 family)
MYMGRIDKIIQKHVDQRIEQKLTFLTERVEKLEKNFLVLNSEISEICKEEQKKVKRIEEE